MNNLDMGMDMDINVNMNKMKNDINEISGMNSRNNMARVTDNGIAGGTVNRRNRTRYSSGLMDYDIDMSAMQSMNKISPDGAANHWFWNEDDF